MSQVYIPIGIAILFIILVPILLKYIDKLNRDESSSNEDDIYPRIMSKNK